MAKITLRGNEFHTNGNVPAVGSAAPDFVLVDGKLANKTLADFAGKKKILSIFPSVDTPVCALSTKKFNDHDPAQLVLVDRHEAALYLRRPASSIGGGGGALGDLLELGALARRGAERLRYPHPEC